MSFRWFRSQRSFVSSLTAVSFLLVTLMYLPPSFAQSPLDDLDEDLRYLERELGGEAPDVETALPAPVPAFDGLPDVDISLSSASAETYGEPYFSPDIIESLGRPKGMRSETITLELKGVEVLDVLKILSKKSGLNIVAGKEVRGQVTLFLQDVDVWIALLTVLDISELAYVEENGIIKVLTVKEFETAYGKTYNDRRFTRTYVLKHAKAVDVSTALSQIKSPLGTVIVDERSNAVIATDFDAALAKMEETIRVVDTPNKTRIFQLLFAEAEDIEGKITEIITPGTGVIKIDTRTNKVIVTDLPEKVDKIAEIVEAFDSEPKQVLIEAKILEVGLNDDFVLGIDWDMVLDGNATLNPAGFGGLSSPSDSPVTSPLSGVTSASSGLSTITLSASEGRNTYSGVIQALEGISKVNILSNPRITVLDKQEARIAVATKQPFVSQTVVQATNTATTADNIEFVDVGVTLSVTPTITDSGYIMLQVRPEVSTAGTPLELQGAGQSATTSEALFTRTIVPVVTSQEAETTVLIRSSETVILAGLIQEREEEVRKKYPFLGDLPLLGPLFRNGGRDFSRNELVIFITPTIVPPTTTDRSYERFLTDRGQLKGFQDAGGFSWKKAAFHSQEPFSTNPRPWWKLDGVEHPSFFPSKKAYTNPLDPFVNVAKLETPGASPQAAPAVPASMTLEGYRQVLKEKIESAVRRNNALSTVGDIRLILTVRDDGAIEEMSFANEAIQNDDALQQDFIHTIQTAGPFPRFPSTVGQPRRSFNFSL